MSYKTWLKRKENATPYANEANCRKCRYGEWVRTSAFCTGQGKPKKIPYKAWDTDKTGYCPEFEPYKAENEETAAMMEEAMTKEETQRACMRIGDNIDRYLKRAGMTQRMLAAYADITEVSISRYISGERAPRATVLYKISKALNCTMEDLMYGVFD